MQRRNFILSTAVFLSMGQMASAKVIKRIPRYRGPKITQVLVNKSDRKLYLLSGKKSVKKFNIGLGFAPEGHKQQEGDGRTPEGLYFISAQNPNSRFHLSLKISYPNKEDRARAKAAGVKPGGDIFIHGGPNTRKDKRRGNDWTLGCIAVSDRQMAWIYAMVEVGTPIYIKA